MLEGQQGVGRVSKWETRGRRRRKGGEEGEMQRNNERK